MFSDSVSPLTPSPMKLLHTCRQFPWRDAADKNSWYGEMRRADRDEITRSVSEEHSVGSVMCGDGVHHCVNNKATRRYSALKFRPRVHQVVVECCCWVFLCVKGCICWADWLEDVYWISAKNGSGSYLLPSQFYRRLNRSKIRAIVCALHCVESWKMHQHHIFSFSHIV